MDLRISTGLNPAQLTPRQSHSTRLARWREGAIAAQQAPPPTLPDAPTPLPRQSGGPDPFPYLLNPFGGFQSSDAGEALQRLRKTERGPISSVEPYRAPRDIPEDAAAKEISKALASAAERQEIQAEQQQATESAQQAIEQEIAAEARRALLAQQQVQLRNRVEQLGTLLEVLVGRYAAAPAPAEPTRLDTRQ